MSNCKVHMEFIDTSAIADSTAASSSGANITDLTLLSNEDAYPDYGIPDLNCFILDGSKSILASGDRIPFVSDDVSGNDCTFITNPVLTVSFTNQHTSAGITLDFISDYPAELKITWYDLNNIKIIEKTFLPDKLKYFCKHQCENYGKVVITFIKTRLPGQRIQLAYVKYGTEIQWTDENIKTASITEEVDVTSSTVPINTCDVAILDENNDFELSNHEGTWKSVQKKQEVSVKEALSGKEVTCGMFYIDTWKSESNIVTFALIDLLGLIDKTKFYGGQLYNGELAGTIISAIMASAGVTNYTVSDDVKDIQLYGHIPICSHREALQQVVFACGAVATCSRTGGISVYMPDRYADSTIGPDRKFLGTTIELDDYVSGIAITYNKYTLQSTTDEIFNDTLPVGVNTIEFNEPYKPDTLTVTAGTITGAKTNYIKVTMSSAGTCVISGKRYESKELTYTANVPIIEAGEEANVLSYGSCTLFNAARVKEVAERILNYYQLRQIVNMRYLLDEEKTGDWVNIRDAKGNTVVTGITQQTIDLTGGFIAEAKCRGYSKVVTNFDYAGELYAGDGIGVM